MLRLIYRICAMSLLSCLKLIKLKNVYLALKDRMPLKRIWRDIWTGNMRGLFHIRSHQNHSGTPKVIYNKKSTAERAAKDMALKRGVHFSNYKYVFCDGYHIGKRWQDRYK